MQTQPPPTTSSTRVAAAITALSDDVPLSELFAVLTTGPPLPVEVLPAGFALKCERRVITELQRLDPLRELGPGTEPLYTYLGQLHDLFGAEKEWTQPELKHFGADAVEAAFKTLKSWNEVCRSVPKAAQAVHVMLHACCGARIMRRLTPMKLDLFRMALLNRSLPTSPMTLREATARMLLYMPHERIPSLWTTEGLNECEDILTAQLDMVASGDFYAENIEYTAYAIPAGKFSDVVTTLVEAPAAMARAVRDYCATRAPVRVQLLFAPSASPVLVMLDTGDPELLWQTCADYAERGFSCPGGTWNSARLGFSARSCSELLACSLIYDQSRMDYYRNVPLTNGFVADVHVDFFFYRAAAAAAARFKASMPVDVRPCMAARLLVALKQVCFGQLHAESMSLQDAFTGYSKSAGRHVTSADVAAAARQEQLARADPLLHVKTPGRAGTFARHGSVEPSLLGPAQSPGGSVGMVVEHGYYGRVGFISIADVMSFYKTTKAPRSTTHLCPRPARLRVMLHGDTGVSRSVEVDVPWSSLERSAHRFISGQLYALLRDGGVRRQLFPGRLPPYLDISVPGGVRALDRASADDAFFYRWVDISLDPIELDARSSSLDALPASLLDLSLDSAPSSPAPAPGVVASAIKALTGKNFSASDGPFALWSEYNDRIDGIAFRLLSNGYGKARDIGAGYIRNGKVHWVSPPAEEPDEYARIVTSLASPSFVDLG